MKKLILILTVLLLACTAYAQTEIQVDSELTAHQPKKEESSRSWELAIGLGLGANSSPYKGDSATVIPFPYVEFDSTYFFWSVFHGGVHLYKNETLSVDFVAHYLSGQFSPSNNDDSAMKALDKRKPTLGLGLAAEYISPIGIFQGDVIFDVLGVSEGFTASAVYYLPWMIKEKTLLLAGIGAEYYSANYNDYYFGISAGEAARSGLSAYEADASFNLYLEVGVIHQFTEKISLTVAYQHSFLPGEIKDSPMVDASSDWKVIGGLLYSF